MTHPLALEYLRLCLPPPGLKGLGDSIHPQEAEYQPLMRLCKHPKVNMLVCLGSDA